jgi:VanZ family protein
VGFFTLSWLLFRSWRASQTLPGVRVWALRWARNAWLMATLVACLDEWHQSYLPSRTGNIHDVMLDSTAALIAQFLLWIFLRHRSDPLAQPNRA